MPVMSNVREGVGSVPIVARTIREGVRHLKRGGVDGGGGAGAHDRQQPGESELPHVRRKREADDGACGDPQPGHGGGMDPPRALR
eukprot:344311-Prorocentrum_minimum.AAC.3